MTASWLMGIAIVFLLGGYIFYGRFIAKKLDINFNKLTPANTKQDGIDYFPTKMVVLFGHHFSSIAGAGPILGPIYAAVFGWIPVIMWILIGNIFIGGVHDFTSLVASIRHGGKTMGEVIEEHIGRFGKKLFLFFVWSVLVLVIAVFAQAVASIFMKEPATVTSSFLFIVIALIFGLGLYRFRIPLWISSCAGVILLILCVYIGIRFPIHQSFQFWIILLFIYVFIAAVTPVWILLQPRDYLNSYLLYLILMGGVIGIFITNPRIEFSTIIHFNTNLGTLFPILFVTVACGAISGFHSLVAAGTTAKQLNNEKDAKPIAYGGMVVEGILAVVALITAITILSKDYQQMIGAKGGGPIGIFASGIGRFFTCFGIPEKAAVTFAALAISAFALTTLDTATRLGRFAFQEFFESENKRNILSKNRYVGTFFTVIVAAFLAYSGTYKILWPLFGSSNQLLASIVLLAVTVWLTKIRKKNRFVMIPMIFMFCVTLTALGLLIVKNLIIMNITLLFFSLLLFAIAILLIFQSWKSLIKHD